MAEAPVTTPAEHDQLDDVAYKQILSAVPGPVTVLTAYEGERAHATTVSAFCSLSIEPRMLLAALDNSSELLSCIRETGRLGVSVLSSDQDDIAMQCARKGQSKLDAVPWRDRHGLPQIDNAVAWFGCDVVDLLPGGDHTIVVCRPVDGSGSERDPLVYVRRGFLTGGAAKGTE